MGKRKKGNEKQAFPQGKNCESYFRLLNEREDLRFDKQRVPPRQLAT